MRAWSLTAIVFGTLIGLAGIAQAQDPHRPAVGGIGSPVDAMIFYLAHGTEGACGPGCSVRGTSWWATTGASRSASSSRSR